MYQGQPAIVRVDEHERRAAHGTTGRIQSVGDPTHESTSFRFQDLRTAPSCHHRAMTVQAPAPTGRCQRPIETDMSIAAVACFEEPVGVVSQQVGHATQNAARYDVNECAMA